MKTYADRKADAYRTMLDTDLDLTIKEICSYCYNWYKYESARNSQIKANRNINKYALKLNNSKKVFALRKQMKNL